MNPKSKNNILETIGNTPLVKLNKVTSGVASTVYAKLEYFNPGGSIKDRVGEYIIRKAEKRGDLKPGGTIIEATSGNTGVGLAITSAIKGYKCIFVMPDKMSEEKIQGLRAFGAKVIVTPTAVQPEDPRSYYSVAKKLVEVTPNSFYANQYNNPDNPEVHYNTTGPEIWEQTEGKVDVLVCGVGTGGTISGIGKYLKEKNPKIQIVGVDPIGSLLHEYFKTGVLGKTTKVYKIEGIGEDFLPDNINFKTIDDFVQVNDKESFMMTRDLLTREGIFAGISSGSAVCGVLKYAKELKDKKNIVVILPDSGNRYLSKAFNDNWMRENGLLDSPLYTDSVNDLLESMDPRVGEVVVATHTDTVEQVIKKMKDKGISQMPVFTEGELSGVIDETDLILPLVNGLVKPSDRILSFIKGKVLMVELEDKLQKLSEMFSKGYVALVKDQKNRLRIVTKIDFISYLGQRLK
ncbi:MAG: cystathionine beta-synthase [Oligoflexia bacterium]|nr:cystathionine beta-synthase [Oligoflexia bacterium]